MPYQKAESTVKIEVTGAPTAPTKTLLLTLAPIVVGLILSASHRF